MDERLNVQNLIDVLAEKHGMDKKSADNFVKDFFRLIENSLESDKYVKIRGLGTFKLINVGSRESINVNTGERFEIGSHTKVSFTPEPSLKDLINKPFAHFETVPLNDNTILTDTQTENEKEEEEEPAAAPVVEEEALVVTEETPAVAEEVPTIEEKEEEVPVIKEEEAPVVEEEPAVTEQPVAVVAEEQPAATEEPKSKSGTMKYFVCIIVFIVLLCGGAVLFTYAPDLFETSSDKPVAEEVEQTPEAIVQETTATPAEEETDTVADSLAAAPTEPQKAAEEEQPAPTVTEQSAPALPAKEEKPATVNYQGDPAAYTIAGTETTYTIKEGETLTKVALRFYGTKALWPYIVKHNPDKIKNPDNVPYGTTIKIPKLVKK